MLTTRTRGDEERKLHKQQQGSLEQQQQQNKSGRVIFQIDEGHRSPQTAAKYKIHFKQFLDFIKIHDLEILLDLGKEAIQELVIRYTRSLRDNAEKKYSRSTVNTRIAAILYFFDNNDIELNRKKIRRYYPSDESVHDDRLYTLEEIQQILSVCDLRSKAMVLLMISSGVRIGALHSMKIGHLTEINFQGLKLYKVKVYAGTRDSYISYCTLEGYRAIQEYLSFRTRCGEHLGDKSPLFRKHFNRLDPFTMNVPKFLLDDSVEKIMDEVLRKSGVKTSEAMRSHALRKGFMSTCERTGMKSINVKMLMGHSIGVENSYYKPTDDDLLNDYMTHAADALTIDPTQRLKQENAELRKTQSDYLAELGDLRHDFNEMKQLLVHLSKESQKQLFDEFHQKVGDKADIEWSCD